MKNLSIDTWLQIFLCQIKVKYNNNDFVEINIT